MHSSLQHRTPGHPDEPKRKPIVRPVQTPDPPRPVDTTKRNRSSRDLKVPPSMAKVTIESLACGPRPDSRYLSDCPTVRLSDESTILEASTPV